METRIRTQRFGIDDIFAEGWRVYRSNWSRILIIVLCVYVPIGIIGWLFQLNPLVESVGYVYLGMIATVAIAYVVEKAIQGQEVGWRDALRFGLSRWAGLIGTYSVEGFILLGLTLLLIVPGIIWVVYYTFSTYVVALRGIWGKTALDYSKNLVQGQWWRVLGIQIVIMAVELGVAVTITLAFAIVSSVSGIETLTRAASITNALVAALFTVMTVVWFLNIDYMNKPGPRVPERGEHPVPPGLWTQAPVEATAAVEASGSEGFETLADRLMFGPLSLSELVHLVNVLAAEPDRVDETHYTLRPEYIHYDRRQNPPQIGMAAPVEELSGAPEYMSPEEVRGQPLDGRSDVYSLAALAYYALTGHPPFEGATEQGIMYKQATEPPRPPRELRPDLPEAIDAVLLKALAKRPDDRYQSAAEFGRALSAAAAGEVGLETGRPAIPEAEQPITSAIPSPDFNVPEGSAREEAAHRVKPLPSGQGAAVKERGLGTWVIVGGVGVLALCLCAWFAYSLYLYTRMSAPITYRSGFSTPTPAPSPTPQYPFAVQSARFSPDEKYIVTGGNDATVRIWEAATGKQVAVLRGHTQAVRKAVYSPDGKQIASASDDKTVRLWDVASGKELGVLRRGIGAVWVIAYSPDGKQILVGVGNATTVWDATTASKIRELKGGSGAAFSPDGSQVATVDNNAGYIWDAATGSQLSVLSGHSDMIWGIGFSPDGKKIVTVSFDKIARIWEAATGKELAILRGHTDRVWRAAFSPDGKQVVTGGADHTVRIWDATTGKEVLVLLGHTKELRGVTSSPDGRRILSWGDGEGGARLWDAATGRQLSVLKAGDSLLMDAAYSADGQRIATAHTDGSVHVWDAATFRELLVLREQGAVP